MDVTSGRRCIDLTSGGRDVSAGRGATIPPAAGRAVRRPAHREVAGRGGAFGGT